VAGRVKTWLWVLVAAAVTCLLAIVAIAGVGFYLFSQHVETRTVSPATASKDFAEVTARFGGRKPLVELDRHGNFVRSNPNRPSPRDPAPPEQLHVMAFDPEDGRVVRLAIPFWLLRLKTGRGSIDLNGSRMNLEDLKLSVAELERFGPSLIVDHTSPEGDRVLVWSQ
jgi:hypothetical protein